MAKSENFDGMPLTKAVKEWLVSEDWEDEIAIDDERASSRVEAKVGINDQPHRLFLEADETSQRLAVYIYSPMTVPPARMADMARILNRINCRWELGRLACYDDEDSNPVQFRANIDVEGGSLSPNQIGTMVGAAIGTFNRFGQLLAAVALTKQPGDKLWADTPSLRG